MIEKKLREYKSNLSKLKLTECSMKQIESEIQVLEPSYISATAYDKKNQYVSEGVVKSGEGAWNKNITLKSGTAHDFHSVVEDAAIENENKQEKADKLKDRLWDMAKERLYLQCKVEEVEAYLTALGAEERFVIESFYFDKLTWPMIADRYRKEFGIYKSIRPLKYKRDDALKKLSENSTVLALK